MFGFPRRVRSLLVQGAVAGMALALVSCGSSDGGSAPAGAEAPASEETRRAPDFVLEDVAGKPVRFSDFDGQVRLVDFWATWCAPCREEIPMFNDLQKEYGTQGFKLLAIAMDEDPGRVVPPFVTDHGVAYTVLLGTEDVADAYGPIVGYPSAFLVDRQGRIVKAYIGPVPKKILEERLRSLLDEGRTS